MESRNICYLRVFEWDNIYSFFCNIFSLILPNEPLKFWTDCILVKKLDRMYNLFILLFINSFAAYSLQIPREKENKKENELLYQCILG